MTQSATAVQELNRHYLHHHPDEVAQWLSERSPRRALAALEKMPDSLFLNVWTRLPFHVAHLLFTRLPEARATLVLARGDPSQATRLLRALGPERREQYLQRVESVPAKDLRRLLAYPSDSAGALMDPVVATFRPHQTAQQVLKYLKRFRGAASRNVLVVDENGRLDGIVDIQDVALAYGRIRLEQLARPAKSLASVMTTREEIAEMLETHKITELPVVDAQERVVGVVRYEGLISAVQDETSADIQTMVGVSKDERALSKVSFKVRKRLPWLQINLATAFLASAVVGLFEHTIAQITMLAVLMPIVAGQAGNTGAQALAVTMRGLALREISTRHWWRMCYKEFSTGFINGIAVALTTAVIVYIWSKSPALSAVIGSAMIVSMVAAALAGTIIPIVLTMLDQDPAQSSTIVLTTITDITGFMTFLGIATLAAAYLPAG